MSTRPFARAPLVLVLLAAGGLACQDDLQSPTSENDAASPGGPAADVTAAATYTVKNLGTLGGASAEANAINDQGRVVGWSLLANGRQHAFLYRAGTMRDLGALAGGLSEATDINNTDVVVGWSAVASGAQRAVRWQNGKITNLGTLGGRNSQATAINDYGVIVGWSETGSGNRHAFVWQNGTMRDLGTLGGSTSVAWDINRAGKIVGGSSTASGEGHAFTWKDGVFKDLGTHGREFATATAVNTKGQIAGILGPFLDAAGEERDMTDPFLYSQGTWISIAGSSMTNEVFGMNNDGLVVGSGVDLRDEEGREKAFVSGQGTQSLLPPLVPTSNGIYRTRAKDINSFGTIVGSSTELIGNSSGPNRAVLWRRQ
jgi:probable HAF family extracellular repeat protein